MTPGKAEYAPVTQKNVPKYFTPGDTSEMLIEKPIRSIKSPARMNGERVLIASDHIAKMMSTVATCVQSAMEVAYINTYVGLTRNYVLDLRCAC